MTIQFPFNIEQLDERTVKVPAGDGPVLDAGFARLISSWGLSEVQVDKLILDMLQAAIAASIKIR
jgi:hypothetical protein